MEVVHQRLAQRGNGEIGIAEERLIVLPRFPEIRLCLSLLMWHQKHSFWFKFFVCADLNLPVCVTKDEQVVHDTCIIRGNVWHFIFISMVPPSKIIFLTMFLSTCLCCWKKSSINLSSSSLPYVDPWGVCRVTEAALVIWLAVLELGEFWGGRLQ